MEAIDILEEAHKEIHAAPHVHPPFYDPAPAFPEPDTAPDPKDFQNLALVFRRIEEWTLRTRFKMGDKRFTRALALRMVARSWCIDPGKFHGESLRTLAERLGGKGTRTVLARLTSEFSREFQIANIFQTHDWRN